MREREGAGVVPSWILLATYIGGFLLSQLKFLLGVFKSLRVLVQLIFSSLELLLQRYQIVLKLRWVSVRDSSVSGGRKGSDQRGETELRECAQVARRSAQQERTGQDGGKREKEE